MRIDKGTCYALFAFEAGQFIDLTQAERLIPGAAERQRLRQPRRAPPDFQYRPAPLRIQQPTAPVTIGDRATNGTAEVVLFDFGAVLVSFAIPFSGELETLRRLSKDLAGHPGLQEAARQQARMILTAAAGAFVRPRLAEMVEDYAIFHVETPQSPEALQDLVRHHSQLIAQILRAESQALAEQEVSDALHFRLSYGPADVTFVDWNAALVVDPDFEGTRAVLEFANVQLLEMRHLDLELDEDLERAYQSLAPRRRFRLPLFQNESASLAHIGTLQADAATLFERVTNALKLVGDMYLSRLYLMVSQRFHLAEWDSSISRKLQTIEGIYQKIADRADSRRLEVLEWIVILLIALEVVLSLVRG
ncbi:MAG: hypothetical protein AB7I33_14165 [Gemmatimonadales bacterium]